MLRAFPASAIFIKGFQSNSTNKWLLSCSLETDDVGEK